jgi:ABC-type branched-subunit amino acid transport system permease subunit
MTARGTPTEPAAPSDAPLPSRRASLARAYAPIVLTGAVLALVPLRYHDSRAMMGVAIGGVLFAAYTIAFNVIFGWTGQLFLCVGALAGLGGYTSAILTDRWDLPMLLGMAAGVVVAGVIGATLSWIAVSRSLDVIFTGIVTLAFSLSFDNLLLGRRDLTGGETGLVVAAGSDTILGGRVWPYYVLLGVVVAYLVVFRVIERSHIGWAFRSLRDDEVAAELAGVNVTKYRVFAGALGAAMLGLAGALYAHSEGFIAPTTYRFGRVDVEVIVMLAFGGIGTMLGPVVGAAVFTVVDEWLVDFQQLRLLIYGVVVIALFLGLRRGVVPTVEELARRVRPHRSARRPAGTREPSPASAPIVDNPVDSASPRQ